MNKDLRYVVHCADEVYKEALRHVREEVNPANPSGVILGAENTSRVQALTIASMMVLADHWSVVRDREKSDLDKLNERWNSLDSAELKKSVAEIENINRRLIDVETQAKMLFQKSRNNAESIDRVTQRMSDLDCRFPPSGQVRDDVLRLKSQVAELWKRVINSDERS